MKGIPEARLMVLNLIPTFFIVSDQIENINKMTRREPSHA